MTNKEPRTRNKEPGTCPWVFENAKPLRKPNPYKHPKGAVAWVDLGGIKL